ncbi:MAG: hypothetical protein JXA67_11440 [Micromonosporaceae bacterium]|nr:hypothetical protein [Micromonosporaceae bacterium]
MIALAGAVGALITVPLVAVPARFAQQADNSAPQFTAGGYAVVGVVIGLVVAIGALNVRSIATNVIATAAWLWVLAAAAVAHGLQIGATAGSAQLATWQFSEARWVRGMVNLPGALLMLGAALLIGVAASWKAGREGDHRGGVAVSGAIGPLLVAAAYFLAVPGLNTEDQQLSAYVTAPYAVIAGLAGSVLVSALGSKGSRERARLAREAKDTEEHEAWQRALNGDEPATGGKSRTAQTKTGQAKTSRARATGQSRSATSRAGQAKTSSVKGDSQTAASDSGEADQETSGSASSKWSAFMRGRGRDKTPAATDLDDDDYASARAYVTDTAGSTGAKASSDSARGMAAGKAKGSGSGSGAAPVDPLWPEETRPSSGKKRRGSR